MTRRALDDDEIGGYFVSAGTEVYISPYLIQRDPDFWERPDSFKPDRFDPNRPTNRHDLAMMPFSAGPRNCVGEHLARLEMQLHLRLIAPPLILRYDSRAAPEIEVGVNLRIKHDFVMTLYIRTPVRDKVAAF